VNHRGQADERQGSRVGVFDFGPRLAAFRQLHSIEIIGFFVTLFHPAAATKQFSWVTKPFFAFRAELRKQQMVIKLTTRTADNAGSPNRRQSNASPQLHPCLRLRPGWPLDGWFDG